MVSCNRNSKAEKQIKLASLQNVLSDHNCQNLNTERWIPMKFIYMCAELHIRGCMLLYSSDQNQWKLNKWEMTQERAPWDTKGQGFSEVQCLGAKETGATKTLKGFSIQYEELFWKLSHDSCDGHSRRRVLLPIRHVFRCPLVELLFNWSKRNSERNSVKKIVPKVDPPPPPQQGFSLLWPLAVPPISVYWRHWSHQKPLRLDGTTAPKGDTLLGMWK